MPLLFTLSLPFSLSLSSSDVFRSWIDFIECLLQNHYWRWKFWVYAELWPPITCRIPGNSGESKGMGWCVINWTRWAQYLLDCVCVCVRVRTCVCVCVCKGLHAYDIPITSITTPKTHKSEPHFVSDSNMLTNIIMLITISGIPMQQAEQPGVQCHVC